MSLEENLVSKIVLLVFAFLFLTSGSHARRLPSTTPQMSDPRSPLTKCLDRLDTQYERALNTATQVEENFKALLGEDK